VKAAASLSRAWARTAVSATEPEARDRAEGTGKRLDGRLGRQTTKVPSRVPALTLPGIGTQPPIELLTATLEAIDAVVRIERLEFQAAT
jgi:hypothetical protein